MNESQIQCLRTRGQFRTPGVCIFGSTSGKGFHHLVVGNRR